MRVAVTGATGYAGGFIVDELLAAGHHVRALVRDGVAADLPGRVEPVRGTLDPDCDFAPLLEGADALVHAAYDHVPGRYRGGEGDDLAGFLRSNVGGSLALLCASRRLGVRRAVLMSSRAIYGSRGSGTRLTEDMAPAPDTHYGAAKATLEAFASGFARQDGWCVAALRPTGIYGVARPVARTKWLDLVRSMMMSDVPVAPGIGTEVHGADVARAVLCLLTAPEKDVAGRAFNCSDLIVSTRDIAEIVGAASGREISLPPDPDRSALNVMTCTGLDKLGFAFSGRPLLERTIAKLVELVRTGLAG